VITAILDQQLAIKTSLAEGFMIVSLAANFLTMLIVASGYLLIGWFWRRRDFLAFFTGNKSLSREKNQFMIYLSGIKWQGSPCGVLSIWELTEAHDLRELFYSLIPGPSGNAGFFRSFYLTGLDCEIKAALTDSQPSILTHNCIIVGSPMYNDAAREFQEKLKSPVCFERHDITPGFMNYQLCVPYEQPNNDEMRGVIVRLRHNGVNYFYAAGKTERSTAGALYFLRCHWHDLYKTYGRHKSFFVQVQVSGPDYKTTVEVNRRELAYPGV